MNDLQLEAVVRAIELAIAPVFLVTAAMALLILALVYFLREVFLATARLKIGPHEGERPRGDPCPG